MTSSPSSDSTAEKSRTWVHTGSFLLSLALFAVIASATLSAFGFRGRVHTVGIDLGTTFSVVAVKLNGTVEVIPDREGRFATPSVVSFRPDGSVLVGHDATPFLAKDPNRTIYNAKRFIGRRFSDAVVQEERSRHPFKVVAARDDDDAVRFSTDHGEIAPEDVGTHILRTLKKSAQIFLGHSQAVTTVVAVPADFGSSARKATRRAFEAAGFSVVRVIDEPTAAAVAYGLHRCSDVHHVLVFDLGGGTLDTSLIHINEGSVQVLLEDGDAHLGGEDFDASMMTLLRRRFAELPPSSSCLSHASLKKMAERAKRELSVSPETSVSCGDSEGRGTFRTVVSRHDFEEEAADLFDRILVGTCVHGHSP